MTGQPIVLLHLSDIHFARNKLGEPYDLNADLRRNLEADAKRVTDILGSPSAIIISGDIAFAGKKDQYAQALEWLDRNLCVAVGGDPSSVRSVCGNHDVDQDIIKKKPTFQDVRKKLRTCNVDEIDRLLQSHFVEPHVFLEPIEAYNRFAFENGSGCEVTVERPVWNSADDLKLNDGTILRIYGLNSALISDHCDHPDTGKMVLGEHQCQIPIEQNVENLIVCHHPPDWLREYDLAEEVLNPRCRLQLFGHKHRHCLTKVNESLLKVAAGAVHPSRVESNWEPRYNWLVIWVETDERGRFMKVSVYPRVWNRTQQRFDADRGNTDVHKDFKAFELKLAAPHASSDVSQMGESSPEMISNSSPDSQATSSDRPSISLPDPQQLPAAPPTTDSRGNAVIDPHRALARRYFQLGYAHKMKIAADLALLENDDDQLTDQERQKQHLSRAKERGLLAELWSRVEQFHNDGRYPTNPFA